MLVRCKQKVSCITVAILTFAERLRSSEGFLYLLTLFMDFKYTSGNKKIKMKKNEYFKEIILLLSYNKQIKLPINNI